MNREMKLTGKDVIAIGIFSAIYFILNFVAMLAGIIPILWILLPGTTGILTGVPFLMMAVKVRKPGAIFIMGLITGLLYFVTGQFTVLILITMAVACILAEFVRFLTKYDANFLNLAISFILFCYGMVGSPIALFVYRDSFLAQISENMSENYVNTIAGYVSTLMFVALILSPILGGFIGALIAKGMFRKHFKKAGVV